MGAERIHFASDSSGEQSLAWIPFPSSVSEIAVCAALIVVTWGFASVYFRRRSRQQMQFLQEATEKLASGQTLDQLPSRHSPELTRISAALLHLHEKVSASTSALREANERMKLEINERRFVEEALRNSERRFRSIWENSLEALRLTDCKGTVIGANAAYCRIMEQEREDVIARPFTSVYAEEKADEILSKHVEMFRTRRLERYQANHVTLRSGRAMDLEVSFSFIELEGDQPLLLGVFRDVTGKKVQEEQRLALERKLLDAQKLESMGILAGGIAHDFNNLLAAILGNANLAQMQLAATETKVAGYLKNIEKTSMRAADLCKQMLAYSGKGRFAMQALDVNEVVRETLELLEVSITKKAALRVELRHGVPKVHADATQLRQVIMNLVINASEAIGENSGMIRVRTGLVYPDANYFADAYVAGEMLPGEYVFVEVSDTGCGMPQETQKRIFDPFFTTKFTGRGLGLAAVLGIVRGHKGALKLSSEVNKGSLFRFLLPLAATPPAVSGTGLSAETPTQTWIGKGTVLIVDDDPTVRAVIARMLESFGFNVLQAVDGRHGVKVFRENSSEIQAVVLDMTMPNLNGREALEQMRAIQQDAKILLVSGFSENCASGTPDGRGPDGFLQKPFKPDELKAKLQAILSKPSIRPRDVRVRIS